MEIRCRCTGCSARFKVEAKYAGKKARCPKCQAVVDVPLTSGDETVSVTPVVAPTPSTPASSAPIPPTPAPTGTAKVAAKSTVITTAIPVPKRAPQPASASLSPAVGNSSTQVGDTGSTIPSFAAPSVEVAPPASQFPSLNTAPPTSPTSSPGSNSASHPRGRKKANLLPLFVGGALTVIAAAVAIVFIIASGSGGKPAGKNGKARTAAVAKDAALLLDWPQGERSGGAIVIDGQRRAIAAAGVLKFKLPPGEHKVVALRRGYEPYDTTFNVVKGQETTIAPIWKEVAAPGPSSPQFPLIPISTISVAGFDGWLQDFEAAKKAAAAAKQDLLIVFGCSDNDQGTQDLARNLAQAGVQQSHVCLVVDFPDTTRGLDVVADVGTNNLLAQQFGVTGVPTLALADDQGRAFFLKRDWSDGFGAMPTKIAEWSKLKAERDALLAAAGTGNTRQELESAALAVRWLKDKSVQRSHAREIKDWLAAAQKLDPENQGALLEVFFEPQWMWGLTEIDFDDPAKVMQFAGQLDPWVARRFQDPDRGAMLHLIAGAVLERAEREEEFITQLKHAVLYQPKDAELVQAIAAAKYRLANHNLLGTGSGFLISTDGHVLTNHHVIEGDGQIEVRLPSQSETIAAKILASDAEEDIALLKIDLPKDSPHKPLPVTIGSLRRLERIAAFGYPYGDSLGTGLKATEGQVSDLPTPNGRKDYLLDLRVNSGNSGGPLCDEYGSVVGMITAKVAIGPIADSYALAIPAKDLLAFLNQHMPEGASRVETTGSLEKRSWPEVSTQVESGVLMILNKKK